MLDLQTVELLLSISETELVEELLIGLLAAPQLVIFFEKFPAIKKALSKDLLVWKTKLGLKLQHAIVPTAISDEFSLYKQTLSLNSSLFFNQLPDIIQQLEYLNSPFTPQAKKLAATIDKASDSFQSLFIRKWRTSLSTQVTTLHQSLIQEDLDQLIVELQERLVINSALEPFLVENEQSAGQLWDMTRSEKYKSDSDTLIEYGKFLSQQPELLKLAQQLGRSYQATSVDRKDIHYEIFRTMVREPATLPEGVNGINQSDDIVRILPSEMALLNIDELEFEFYRRFLEQRLLTYQLKGEVWREQARTKAVSKIVTDKQARGPFIVCVDTSGSMGGFNEKCAKAFCLALLRIAMADNRRCYILLFSTDVIHYELTSDRGIAEAIRFLSQRFQGGTDLAACLSETLDKIDQKDWQDADTVIISDFIAQRLPDALVSQIKNKQKKHSHRFHAVAMSKHGKPNIMKIFDHIWRFDTGLGQRLRRRWQIKNN
ncbi:ATPase RavA stimulator ViaA [Budvicia aquatica]|uniref:ATPase RavA stimulator ViaA n=1 Tax=Budvicia aquatica TaxID=82979 RepID=A0A2C6DJA3_9GAMM|nr:ATPase RavA stimulator ViaA [Budvicia aquatica]PHI28412.1 ATPase RavA stimulator ViaA [Budvicia aquatica]VFS46327.1 VWA domain protein interacting with AAA ATPase [Budvicia aquatica]